MTENKPYWKRVQDKGTNLYQQFIKDEQGKVKICGINKLIEYSDRFNSTDYSKYIKITIVSLLFYSCSKDWSCTVTNNGNETDPVHFHGTTEEAQEYEQQNTWTVTLMTGQTVVTETNCLPE